MKPEHKHLFTDLAVNEILGLCIWAEARSEPYNGRVAVGSVVLNRVDKGGWFGDTIHKVIMKPYQFSWLNDTDRQYPKCVKIAEDFVQGYYDNPTLESCVTIADKLLAGWQRNVKATHYHTHAVHPKWAEKMVVERTIGNHVFYVELTTPV